MLFLLSYCLNVVCIGIMVVKRVVQIKIGSFLALWELHKKTYCHLISRLDFVDTDKTFYPYLGTLHCWAMTITHTLKYPI